jgi:hypothetical protein
MSPVSKKTGTPAKGSTAVTKVGKKALASPDDMAMFEELSREAQPTFEREDLAIPFLRILQDLSPQVKKKDEGYVPGAEPGKFYNTVTKELYDGEDGILVVPVYHTPSVTEWKTREKGGGLVKDHGADRSILKQTTRDDKNRDMLPNGHQVTLAAMYYLFLVDPETGRYRQVAFPLQGTQLKKAKAWNTSMQMWEEPKSDGTGTFSPAMFYGVYRLTSAYESNDKGSWYGVNIVREDAVPNLPNGWKLFQEALAFHKAAKAGEVKTRPVEELAQDVSLEKDDDAF